MATRRAVPRLAVALFAVLLEACSALTPMAGRDTVVIRNDAHSPVTIEASPSGDQLDVAACATVVLPLDQAGWRIAIDGHHAFSHEEVVASGINDPERWVRIVVTSNDLVADVRVGDVPEAGIIVACADV